MNGLEGLRVIELGELVSAAYAAKLMADLGADVVKIEELQGDSARRRGPFPRNAADPEKSGLFLYLNANKRGAMLDLRESGGAFTDAIKWADILVHNYPPARMTQLGIDYARLSSLNPRLVMCSITPFGLTGPYKDYKAHELTVVNAGGWAWLSPGASDRPELPPLKPFGHQTGFQAGTAAAMASLAAYSRAVRTGRGEHVDLSAQEYVASLLEQNFVHYTYAGNIASRLGKRLLHPWGSLKCKDGDIFLLVGEDDQWRRLVEMMGSPEWTQMEIFQTGFLRTESSDVLKMYLEEWTANWTVAGLFRAGQENRVCFSPVSSMADLKEQPQLRERGFFADAVHPRAGALTYPGAPYKLGRPWWKFRRAAPLLGEHTRETAADWSQARPAAQSQTPATGAPHGLPLEGIRVIDFSWVWAGPYCTMQLAHLGAEVIRLESSARPDLGRRLPIYPKGMEGNIDRCGYFNQWNQGKKSVQLNLAKPEASEIAKALIRKSDVVVDNFATGVMEGFGLGHEELLRLKPDLIVASISGYGHTGPQKDYMGYGPAIVMLSGLASLTGYRGGPPLEVGISLGDPNGGIHAAAAICAALAARARNGGGQSIDLSLWEAMGGLVAEGWMDQAMNGRAPERDGNRDPLMAPHNCFPCAGDDEWVSIACGDDDEWGRLCIAIERPELAREPRFGAVADRKANEDRLEEIVGEWTRKRGKWEVTRTLQAAGVAAFPSMNSRDLAEDPHLDARGFFARLPHAAVGVRTHAGIPWRLTNAGNGVRRPAPLLGEHTRAVMRDLLGYSEEEVERLIAAKVLH
jgi:crotonobetainyl-CoA:carnitine CoA-transferase CaiB-like acyl-CoA transferase